MSDNNSDNTRQVLNYSIGGSDTQKQDNSAVSSSATPQALIDSTAQVEVNSNGLSSEELTDANKIKVTIVDKNTPIVIMFGPPACGKTMTLVRLTRYLKNFTGYGVTPIKSFRPAYDSNYKSICENFDQMINSDDAAESTSRISFMLVNVMYKGKPVCQLLEGPGEYYFNPDRPKDSFPAYVNTIKNSNNRRIWLIMVEPDDTNSLMDQTARRNYVDKVKKLKSMIPPKDKIIFLFNKVDATSHVISPGEVRYADLMKTTKNFYPNIFVPFSNENPITKLWKPYNFDFVAFCTGDYTRTADGDLTYQEGPDTYPRKLWSIIKKRING